MSLVESPHAVPLLIFDFIFIHHRVIIVAIKRGAKKDLPLLKLPAIPSGRDRHAGASREGKTVLILPLDPAYKAGLSVEPTMTVRKVLTNGNHKNRPQ